MARLTRRQIVTTASFLYLAALTILACFPLYLSNEYSLPIPNILSALTVALPPLAGIALEAFVSSQSHSAHRPAGGRDALQTSGPFFTLSIAFLIFEVVLATLAGTHIAPTGGLFCPLHDRWTQMRHERDAGHIRRIQDAFDCCGFNGLKDMAYPFEDAQHGADRCLVTYDRTRRCLEPWMGLERRVAIMLLVVPLAVFVWKLVLFVILGQDRSWLPSAIRLPSDSANEAGGSGLGSTSVRPAITFQDTDDDSTREETNHLNRDSNLAMRVELNRSRSSPLIQERENF